MGRIGPPAVRAPRHLRSTLLVSEDDLGILDRGAAMHMGDAMAQMTWEELRQLPSAVDLETAGRALGIGRSKIYEMARKGELQQTVKVLKLGHAYRVVTADLYRVLGVSLDDGLMPSAGIAADLQVPDDPALPEQGGPTGITRALRSPDGTPGPGTDATRRATRRLAPSGGNAAAC